jgi:hypothetical protein
MSWKSKYVGWYSLAKNELGELIPGLDEREVMENVSYEDRFITPLLNSVKDPQLFIILSDNNIKTGIIYTNKDNLDHLENILRETHHQDLEKLLEAMHELGEDYHTTLNKEGVNGMEIISKYLSIRMDTALLKRLIDQSNRVRKGGRMIQNNESIYVPPQTPELCILETETSLDEEAFTDVLAQLKPVFEILRGVKTRREIIREKLSKPDRERNQYSEYVSLLNLARSKGLISPEERRELDRLWRTREEDQDNLINEIKKIIYLNRDH